MTSKVSICNMALANVGKPDITTIDEDSAEARACRVYYDQTLAALLEVYPWRFARRTVAMAEVTNAKPNRWQKAFRRPSDCRKVLIVADEDGGDFVPGLLIGVPYEIEGNTVYCDLDVAYMTFTADQPDPTIYSALFIDALSWQLTVRLAMPMTRDSKVRADAYQLADRMTTTAAVHDANEVRISTDTPSPILEART